MRNLAAYTLAAFIFGLALDFIVPAASIGTAAPRWPALDASAPVAQQTVNRDGKADRLASQVLNSRGAAESQTAAKPVRVVPEGCDPAFSPLSASASLNYASRCLADNASGQNKAS